MRLPNVENYNNSGKFVNMFISTANSLEKSYNLLTDKDRLKFIKQVETVLCGHDTYITIRDCGNCRNNVIIE